MKRNRTAVGRVLAVLLMMIIFTSAASSGIMQTHAVETCTLTLRVTGSGSLYYPYNGTERRTTSLKSISVAVGTEITLRAEEKVLAGYPSPFMYWFTDKNRIISEETSYTFTVTGPRTIFAVFGTHQEGTYFVNYYNYGGVLLDTFSNITSGTIPETINKISFQPILPGHSFLSWDQQPDDYKNSTSFVLVRPTYEVIPVNYDITTTNTSGVSGAGSYKAFSKAAVYAKKTDNNGDSFLYWTDADTGDILSYNNLYAFYVSRAVNLTAVYGNSPVGSGVCVRISGTVTDAVEGVVTFYAERSVTSDLMVLETGILMSTSPLEESTFVVNSTVSRGMSKSTANSGLYSLMKKNVSIGSSVYARAYVVYRDANGTVSNAYSDIYTQTM